MKTTYKTFTKYLFIALLLMLTGCIKENTDNCSSGLILKFKFVLHTNEGNMFGPDVQLIRVYLFDQNGVLAHVQQERGAELTNDYAMNVQIAPGRYTIIAWGGSNEDFENSYFEGHMNNPAMHDYEDGVTVGRTTLDQFRVMLKYNIADDLPEDIVPVVDELDDLYYGAVGTRTPLTSQYVFERVDVKAGAVTQREIELIKNTNLIKVTVTGLGYLTTRSNSTRSNSEATFASRAPTDILQVWATAKNGRYRFDNSIGEYSRTIRYTPHYQAVDRNTMVVDIKVLRLDIVRHQAEPVYLSVQNPVTGATYPSKPIDVVNMLLQAKNIDTGEYIYQSQEGFDKIYEHQINIEILSDLRIRIFVQGWEFIAVVPGV